MRAHRALRLFVTAGAWAAGLCLIIGSVALVAEAAGPAPEAHVTTAAGYPQRTRPLPGHGAKAHHAPASSGSLVVLRTFVGTGNRTTSQFTVAAHSRWELRWSYQCAARLPRGRLVIREGNDAGGGVSVDAAGAAGQGSAWTYSDVGSHSLVVLANCAWTIDVAGHR